MEELFVCYWGGCGKNEGIKMPSELKRFSITDRFGTDQGRREIEGGAAHNFEYIKFRATAPFLMRSFFRAALSEFSLQ